MKVDDKWTLLAEGRHAAEYQLYSMWYTNRTLPMELP